MDDATLGADFPSLLQARGLGCRDLTGVRRSCTLGFPGAPGCAPPGGPRRAGGSIAQPTILAWSRARRSGCFPGAEGVRSVASFCPVISKESTRRETAGRREIVVCPPASGLRRLKTLWATASLTAGSSLDLVYNPHGAALTPPPQQALRGPNYLRGVACGRSTACFSNRRHAHAPTLPIPAVFGLRSPPAARLDDYLALAPRPATGRRISIR